MTQRIMKCSACTGVSTVLPDADWTEVQRHIADDWWERHLQEAHDGADSDRVFWEVDPDFFRFA